MTNANLRFRAALAAICLMLCAAGLRADETVTNLPSDTPTDFVPRTNSFDYVKRTEMIPMRDGCQVENFHPRAKGRDQRPHAPYPHTL